jgi:hypothetical protein
MSNPLGDYPRKSRESSVRLDDIIIFLMVLPIGLAAFIHLLYAARVPESPKTRDILLTVPQESSVNAQVTSENNTVNITDL